jgi:hypothetical protein
VSRVRCLIICALVIWCVAVVLPWSSAAATGRPEGQAIQFRVGSDFTLSQFDGATFAYQRFVSGDVAWRVSLGLDLQQDTGDESEEFTGENSYDVSGDVSEWDHAISLSSEWLAYRGEGVSVFFGGGPRASYNSRQYEGWYFYPEYGRLYRRSNHSFGVGLQGTVGIQWTATEWMALHAEYNMRCMYLRVVEEEEEERIEELEETERYVETRTLDRFQLDSRGVRFGLSAYF